MCDARWRWATQPQRQTYVNVRYLPEHCCTLRETGKVFTNFFTIINIFCSSQTKSLQVNLPGNMVSDTHIIRTDSLIISASIISTIFFYSFLKCNSIFYSHLNFADASCCYCPSCCQRFCQSVLEQQMWMPWKQRCSIMVQIL